MINIFGLPKVARTYRGWEYDLWVTVCQDIRHWKEIPIGEVKKLKDFHMSLKLVRLPS
jgi:hypothetical protein